jgi:hypothetical protein
VPRRFGGIRKIQMVATDRLHMVMDGTDQTETFGGIEWLNGRGRLNGRSGVWSLVWSAGEGAMSKYLRRFSAQPDRAPLMRA